MDRQTFWSLPVEEVFQRMASRKEGLSSGEALERLHRKKKPLPLLLKRLLLFLSQFKSPFILLLLGAAILSFSLGSEIDAMIIMIIVIVSASLGFIQEFGAVRSLEKLLATISIKAKVLRDGQMVDIPFDQVVPGDMIELVAGNILPGDALLLESNHLFMDESSLTGESFPVEKKNASAGTPLDEKTHGLFMGTHVLNGKGFALIYAIGEETAFGEIQAKSQNKPPETAFEKGMTRFGVFLLSLTIGLVTVIFCVNLLLDRPILEALLFSLAIAVGLTPQLLPAIVAVNLAHGARRMARNKVIVKHLSAIENFGQMNILCSDKTGTVTEGTMQFEQAVDPLGGESERCHQFGYLNAFFQSTYPNPLDTCILAKATMDTSGWEKIDEIPYDFDRKRLSVLLRKDGQEWILTKGAVDGMLAICSTLEWRGGDSESLSPERKEEIKRYFESAAKEGFRTLAVGYGTGREEQNLCLIGFLHFRDPIKKDIKKVVDALQAKGIQLKILTGDNYLVSLYVANHLGLTGEHLIKGSEIGDLADDQLFSLIKDKNIFAEIVPSQKEKIILALRKAGNVVGYLGDGINDVSALRSADVGVSVDQGADAAKESSDFILLRKNLSVLLAGVEEGRHTFANTIKYVYMAVSANFGNMFSMAGTSLFLPFLPLLPKQILLTNLLTDVPEMAISADRVDRDLIHRPVRWDLTFICKFMVVFGLISSIFDYLTFAVLLFWINASVNEFRTGWFIESVASAALVALFIRTRHWFFTSRPGTALMITAFISVTVASLLPLTPLANVLGFVPLPLWVYGVIFGIIAMYLGLVELAKRIFFRKERKERASHH